MSPLAKVFVVLVTILNLLFLGTSATLYKTQENWREIASEEQTTREENLAAFKEQKQALQGERTQLQTNLANKSEEAARLEALLTSTQADVADKSATITRHESRITELQAHVQQKDGHIQEKDKEIARITDSNEQFREAEQKAIEDSKKAKLLMTAAILDKQRLEEQLEAATIEVANFKTTADEQALLIQHIEKRYPGSTSSLGTRLPNPVDGVVVSYDAGEQVLALSVGADDGVQLGDELTIFNGGVFIGKVKVTRVGADISGATVMYTADGLSVQPGFSASSRFNY